MNRTVAWIVVIGALGVAGAAGWHWYQSRQPDEAAVEIPPPPPAAAPAPESGEPVVQHPLETDTAETASAPPLPPLAESDAPLVAALGAIAGADAVATWLIPEGIVRRFVATVDNLPRTHVAERLRPLRGAPGPFLVERTTLDAASGEERIVPAAQNATRYDAAIAALQALDMRQVAALYRRFYPLLQQAYEDLGYPGRYFNDRVVAVIDHLLATPVPEEPPALVQPKVLYQYADAALEARSAGQKLLIRMGPEHAQAVKAQLTALRAEISRSTDKE